MHAALFTYEMLGMEYRFSPMSAFDVISERIVRREGGMHKAGLLLAHRRAYHTGRRPMPPTETKSCHAHIPVWANEIVSRPHSCLLGDEFDLTI
ncbi:hypothetical protein KDAU_59310 [Dictyobacter aurantiacus]|uniref:Uncharacterized protein n=1 Tax=Dictyobacter aurantiacus TaxID=1936993 RepID=A0A401ZP31_9CHLR|nr:hypothetical protein KDAU_59310 [Dictyobacter aurantiacus]